MGRTVNQRKEDRERVKNYSKLLGIAVAVSEDYREIQVYIPSLHGEFDSNKVSKSGEYGDNYYPWANVSIEDLTYRNKGRDTISKYVPDTNTAEGGNTASMQETTGLLKQPVDALSSRWLHVGLNDGKLDIVWVSFRNGDTNYMVYEDTIGYIPKVALLIGSIFAKFAKYGAGTTQSSRRKQEIITGSISVGGWEVPGLNLSVSTGGDYRGNKSLEELAEEVVFGDIEYDYVGNKTSEDNSLIENICISKLELTGNNARDFIKLIADTPKGAEYISQIESSVVGVSLNLDKDWSYLIATDPEQERLSVAFEVYYLLHTHEFDYLQDSIICNRLHRFIVEARDLGIGDPKTLIYYCDIANSNYDEAQKILRRTVNRLMINGEMFDSLSAMHNETIGGGYSVGSYLNDNNIKRKKTYDSIKEMDMNGAFTIEVDMRHKKMELQFLYPVDYKYKITTEFGYYIRERSLKDYEYIYHDSIDITGEDIFGKPVRAGLSGLAMAFDSDNLPDISAYPDHIKEGIEEMYRKLEIYNSGICVIIGYNDESSSTFYYVKYSHLSGICDLEFYNLGDVEHSVNKGDVIGYVGYSGDTSGICLNVKLFKRVVNGRQYYLDSMDPTPYIVLNTNGDKPYDF